MLHEITYRITTVYKNERKSSHSLITVMEPIYNVQRHSNLSVARVLFAGSQPELETRPLTSLACFLRRGKDKDKQLSELVI
jgi:hypothetical protein